MIRPNSQNSRLLAVLADGRWHVSRELHERCGYMRTNSRISELRAHGHHILGESVPGKTGCDGYRYKLAASPPLEESVEESTAGSMSSAGSLSGEQLTFEDVAA